MSENYREDNESEDNKEVLYRNDPLDNTLIDNFYRVALISGVLETVAGFLIRQPILAGVGVASISIAASYLEGIERGKKDFKEVRPEKESPLERNNPLGRVETGNEENQVFERREN